MNVRRNNFSMFNAGGWAFGFAKRFIFLIAFVFSISRAAPIIASEKTPAEKIIPPPAPREFRAAWITTVANIDWPSKPGLPVAQQQAEMVSLLDRAAQLHFNAVFFQVRTVGDALYASPLEPWSEYLTGAQGRAPQPFYDPLAFAIQEAHKRGLALHAWFNPFRAGHPEAKSPAAANHITRAQPGLVRHYGRQIWLDPGDPAAQARALAVVSDVVKRYDVDGVVFDDYFYPYPEKNGAGVLMDFPDDASWKKFSATPAANRGDWRRANINQFVQKVSSAVHAAKPGVAFGISPFGIWRPGVPAGIDLKALDSYDRLYADARLWLANGWLDYVAPQLYWPIADQPHGFAPLLDWWRAQNPKGRHVWPALSDANVDLKKFSADEIPRQIQVVRQRSDPGEIHYHLRSVLENPALAASTRAQYAVPALVPASPWLNATSPAASKLTVTIWKKYAHAQWQPGAGKPAANWVFQMRTNGVWTTQILPPGAKDVDFAGANPDAIAVRAADRQGNLSEPAVWRK
jgi:uncharacterized lipoprotein YddW (UPF0748 family)